MAPEPKLSGTVAHAVNHAVHAVIEPVQAMHHAIADPWLRGLAESHRQAYHRATSTVYDGVRFGSLAIGLLAQSLTDARSDSAAATSVTAAANAVFGDALAGQRNDPAAELSLHLMRGEPAKSGQIVVVLHGLGETERRWENEKVRPLLDALEAEGRVVLGVRYNTGRRISDTGESLALALQNEFDAWAVPVHDVAFIGYSMGGLVARSAVLAGERNGKRGWIDSTSAVITVATPHLGSPIEKGAHLGAHLLRVAPQSRPLAALVDNRSVGIQDLRHGAITEQQWSRPGAPTSPWPRHVDQHTIAAIASSQDGARWGRAVGDFIVRVRSASGAGRRRRIEATTTNVVTGQNHFGIPGDPAVHQRICELIGVVGAGDS